MIYDIHPPDKNTSRLLKKADNKAAGSAATETYPWVRRKETGDRERSEPPFSAAD